MPLKVLLRVLMAQGILGKESFRYEFLFIQVDFRFSGVTPYRIEDHMPRTTAFNLCPNIDIEL